MRVATRRELVAAIRVRYQTAARAEKQKILDEFVAVTGFHRKHAVRILGGTAAGASRPRRCGGHPVMTNRSVKLWSCSGRPPIGYAASD